MKYDALASLRADLDRAGYYPELVAGVIDVARGGEPVQAFLVHPETTFDSREVRRHLTALALTPSRLIVAHVDDVPGDDVPSAAATTDAVPLSAIRSVSLTHGVVEPARAHGSVQAQDLTISVAWGAMQRIDMEPMTCPDPECEADHGYTGIIGPDDIIVRVSAQAEGRRALTQAIDFARQLSIATATPL